MPPSGSPTPADRNNRCPPRASHYCKDTPPKRLSVELPPNRATLPAGNDPANEVSRRAEGTHHRRAPQWRISRTSPRPPRKPSPKDGTSRDGPASHRRRAPSASLSMKSLPAARSSSPDFLHSPGGLSTDRPYVDSERRSRRGECPCDRPCSESPNKDGFPYDENMLGASQ